MNQSREKIIIRTSIIGIIGNVFLASFKAFIGILSNSIAVTLDAVNNLSDALSSIITIIGTKLSNKPADKKHPMGYGRIEYLSATIIAFIVFYAGITSMKESITSIIHPSKPDYSSVALIIIAVGVITKVLLGKYFTKTGKSVDSNSLIASGEDALNDAVISGSTLVAAFIYIFFHVSLEAYLGVIISVVIIKSGIDMLRDTLSEILGERIDSHLSKDIKRTICSVPGVHGAYDLILDAYGVDRYQGSVHIEVLDTLNAAEIDDMTREISERVYKKHHVILTGVGIYAINTRNDQVKEMRTRITRCVMSHDHVIQMHGFYVNEAEKHIQFDIIIDFKAENSKEIYQNIINEVQKMYPDYSLAITLDTDISD